jgi:hypothetical protein
MRENHVTYLEFMVLKSRSLHGSGARCVCSAHSYPSFHIMLYAEQRISLAYTLCGRCRAPSLQHSFYTTEISAYRRGRCVARRSEGTSAAPGLPKNLY